MTSSTVLKNEVKVIIILVMIVEFDNVFMIEVVHDLNLELDLLNQIMLDDLCLVDDLDGKNVFGHFVPHFVNFAEAADANVGISE